MMRGEISIAVHPMPIHLQCLVDLMTPMFRLCRVDVNDVRESRRQCLPTPYEYRATSRGRCAHLGHQLRTKSCIRHRRPTCRAGGQQ